MTTESKIARDALFRRIGRNVVNFQYLEATLRRMIPALSYKGTVKELEQRHKEKVRKYERTTFGNLADAIHDNLYVPHEAEDEIGDEPLTELKISYSFRLGGEPEEIMQLKRSLVRLVVERNRLIHTDFLSMDLSSPELCEEHSQRLDEQNERIIGHLNYFNSIQEGIQEGFAKQAEMIKALYESGELLAAMRGESGEESSDA